ncbi:MAG: proline--tRNA ligase [Candidatus Eremiobacteraeota bacterium]|nr:proline--tRNA ligase [Candidatus Eremiobacteraeota bacterium]
MRVSKMLTHTLKEDPQEAEVMSHKLMIRAGMLRRVSSGIYNYLPLGWKVIRKVMDIIREEMNAIEGQELLMPAMNPRELWEETGRWEEMGDNLFRLKDRWGRDYCLGMTHEEVITDIARKEIQSYKDLPIMLYQIQTKFRDEPRPRAGVMRGREFIMKDAYSFHDSDESLDEKYRDNYRAYWRIFARCGMETVPVKADPGPIGGTDNHEFMVLSPVGEDTVFLCECGNGANKEMAYFKDEEKDPPVRSKESSREKIHTPGVSTIEKLCKSLKISADRFMKAIVYIADGKPIMAIVRGDRDINQVKLRRGLGVKTLAMANDDEILKFTGGHLGFSGPVGMDPSVVVADPEIKYMVDTICGANEKDYHFRNVNPGTDFTVGKYIQIRDAVEGDKCPECGKVLDAKRSIELGHIFKLGRKYSNDMKATFLDDKSERKTFIMGCYGIGVTRIVAAVIETHNDKNGIIWPISIAPYECLVMPVMYNDDEQRGISEEIYKKLKEKGIDVAYDDRDSRPGFKFKDADLIGYPLRVIVGKKAIKDGLVELKLRDEKEAQMVKIEEVVDMIIDIIKVEKTKLMSFSDRFEECPC